MAFRKMVMITPYAKQEKGFSYGSAGKESACSVGDLGLIRGLGSSPGEGKVYPLQYSFLENPTEKSDGLQCMGVTKS